MSAGYFSRTSRKTSQINLNKSQQVTEVSTNPSQISNIVAEQSNKGGYVYKPPSKIGRSNINTIKQTPIEKAQKGEQKSSYVKNETLQQTSATKSTSFVRKPQNQPLKAVYQVKKVTQNPVQQTKQQPKTMNKPISRLNANRQVPPLEIPKQQQKNSQQVQLSSKSMHALDLKKPLPFSYPKKISRRGPQVSEQSQQNKTITNQNEQKLQQTPKFNRLQKHQQSQNPPAASLQYQRKAINQPPQTSQSTNSLRSSQSSIKPLIQKVQQSPKIIQKPIQSPSKSLISHSSRYTNKIQTPVKQQQKIQQNEIKNLQIKRSNLILFSLHRLFKEKYRSHFQQFCAYSKQQKESKHNQKPKIELEKVLLKFCQRYQNGFSKSVFSLMKSIYSKIAKVQMSKSIDPKNINQLIAKRNQCFVRVLSNITLTEIIEKKQTFNKLKNIFDHFKLNQKKIIQGAKILCNKESKKLKSYFSLISQLSFVRNSVKNLKITRCLQINKNLTKQILFVAFRNIEAFKANKQSLGDNKEIQTKSLSKLPQNKQKQLKEQSSLLEPNKQLKQKVIELQKRVEELKKTGKKSQNLQELKVTISQLKQQNQAISQQIQVKRQKNSQLKQKIDSLMINKPFSSQEQLSSISQNKLQNQEPTLSLVHEIYMKAYKQSEEQCISDQNILSLCNIHRVEENKVARKTIADWLAVEDNLMLKHWINLYEGNYVNNNSEGQSQIFAQRKQQRKKIEEENQIIKKFIRSYIKQRYMWEEVKEYVAAVIQQ